MEEEAAELEEEVNEVVEEKEVKEVEELSAMGLSRPSIQLWSLLPLGKKRKMNVDGGQVDREGDYKKETMKIK